MKVHYLKFMCELCRMLGSTKHQWIYKMRYLSAKLAQDMAREVSEVE